MRRSDVSLQENDPITMPLVRVCVFRSSGVPEKPQINGLKNPAMEGEHITLTCITQGSKPAADLRWFRNEKEIKGA